MKVSSKNKDKVNSIEPDKLNDRELVDFLKTLNWNNPDHKEKIREVCTVIRKRNLLDKKYTSPPLNPPDPFRMD